MKLDHGRHFSERGVSCDNFGLIAHVVPCKKAAIFKTANQGVIADFKHFGWPRDLIDLFLVLKHKTFVNLVNFENSDHRIITHGNYENFSLD